MEMEMNTLSDIVLAAFLCITGDDCRSWISTTVFLNHAAILRNNYISLLITHARFYNHLYATRPGSPCTL